MEPNTPSKPPTALTPFTRIYNALSLMNSMIIGGEAHSPVSITLYEEAMQQLATLELELSEAKKVETEDWTFCQSCGARLTDENMNADGCKHEAGRTVVTVIKSRVATEGKT